MVDHSALVTIRQAKYSVPASLIGRRVRALLRASEVLIFDGRRLVARHERVAIRNGQAVLLDHYLEVLRIKPGALSGSTVLAHARATGAFTPEHEAFWEASRRVNGDAAGTRELLDVLELAASSARLREVGPVAPVDLPRVPYVPVPLPGRAAACCPSR